jgi:GTP-binding protein HflX
MEAVARELAEPTRDETLRLGFDQGRKRAWLFDRKLVRSERQTDGGYEVAVRWTDRDRSQYMTLQ